jgi:hypothetical protein
VGVEPTHETYHEARVDRNSAEVKGGGREWRWEEEEEIVEEGDSRRRRRRWRRRLRRKNQQQLMAAEKLYSKDEIEREEVGRRKAPVEEF